VVSVTSVKRRDRGMSKLVSEKKVELGKRRVELGEWGLGITLGGWVRLCYKDCVVRRQGEQYCEKTR
jgi:hypothetical protein